jgi:hypothetical protein
VRGKLKHEAIKYPSSEYLIDTIIEIDHRYFAAIGFVFNDTVNKSQTQYLNSATPLKNNLLEIFFEYRKSYKDTIAGDFMKNSFDALKSIQINNGG